MNPVTTDNHEQLVSAPEAGRRLGITTREVFERVDAGTLRAVRTDDGPRIVLADDLTT